MPYQQCVRLSNRRVSVPFSTFNNQPSSALIKSISDSKQNESMLSRFSGKQYFSELKRNQRFDHDFNGTKHNDVCVKRVWNDGMGRFVPEYVPYLNEKHLGKPVRPTCGKCANLSPLGQWNLARSIYRSNGIPSSMQTSKVGGLAVANSVGNHPPTIPSQTLSDRNNRSVVKRQVPTRGNSIKGSITRMRPGATSAAGVGVDVKHGSFHRRLLKLKGRMLLGRASQSLNSKFAVSKSQGKAEAGPVYTNLTGVWSGTPLPGVSRPSCNIGNCRLWKV